ncbi:MAG: metal ABC transporter solute-binding protein, Zn/Mn family [Desulfopila sp.]
MKKWLFSGVLMAFLVWCAPALSAVTVFVSIPPQKWLVEVVAGEEVKVEVLVKSGQDPHTFEPLPRQVAMMAKSRLWFTIGMPFERQLKQKIAGTAPGLTVVAMDKGIVKLPMADGDHDHGHGHVEEDPADYGPYEADLADPHVWLSPSNLQLMAWGVGMALADIDPAHSREYHDNVQRVCERLARLDTRIKAMLAPYRGASFFVYHPTFGYFADAYGLHQEAVEVGGKSPEPRQLAALIGKAKAEKVKIIFVQPQFDPKAAEAIAAAIGGRVVPLDALAEDVPENLLTIATRIEEVLRQ